MSLITQIGGISQTNVTALRDVLLAQAENIEVTHPHKGGIAFSEWENPWSFYESELHLFESIATSDFHIIANDGGVLNETLALQILYAMVMHKPVVLLAEPSFDDSVDAFTRQTVRLHRDQLLVIDLDQLAGDKTDFTRIIDEITRPVAYQLTNYDEAFIKSDIRHYFRSLLEDAKNELLAVI